MLTDPAGYLQGQILERVQKVIPGVKGVEIAAELGKELAEAADEEIKSLVKIFTDAGVDPKIFRCVEEQLNENFLSLETLDTSKIDGQIALQDALNQCDCNGLRMVQIGLFLSALKGVGKGAKNFVVGDILGRANKKLKGKLDKIDDLTENPAVKDAMEYALEQAKKSLEWKIKGSK